MSVSGNYFFLKINKTSSAILDIETREIILFCPCKRIPHKQNTFVHAEPHAPEQQTALGTKISLLTTSSYTAIYFDIQYRYTLRQVGQRDWETEHEDWKPVGLERETEFT